MSMSSFSAVSRTSRGGSRRDATASARFSATDAGISLEEQGGGPAQQHADRVSDHVGHFEAAIAGHFLQELDGDAHDDESRRIRDSRRFPRIDLAEKEHQQPIGGEVPELVALLDVDGRRVRGEREPEDAGDPPPAEAEEDALPQTSAI